MNPWVIGAGLLATAVSAGASALWNMFAMPGENAEGPLPPPCNDHEAMVAGLKQDVYMIAGQIGERHVQHQAEALTDTAAYIESRLTNAGLRVRKQSWIENHVEVSNLEVEFKGRVWPDQIIVIGAHYDSAKGSPGANDNASGVAGALLIACRLAATAPPARTIRVVFFANEEEPYFQSEAMGSMLYAARSAERGDAIVAMLAVETIGFYSEAPGSQHYPEGLGPILPDVGDFAAFVGNIDSSALVRQVVGAFRYHGTIPGHGVCLPESINPVGWSDHWAFWQHGYPAVMVTDTALYRYPHYHSPDDTPDKLDYDRMARVVDGLLAVLSSLSEP